MGLFWQRVRVGNPAGGDFAEVDALVDTGATDSVFPASFLDGLHLRPAKHLEYKVADGRVVELPYGAALISIGGETWPCPVLWGPDDEALLGATTLEIFKLLVDPNSQSLRPAYYWPLGWGGRPVPRAPES